MSRGARLLLAFTAVAGCSGERAPAPATIGSAAPPYQALGMGGDSAALDQYRGHAVLLNVWATWCEPCRDEMPALEAAHRELAAQGLRVVAVSIDQRSGDADVRRFLEQYGITFTILRDPDDRVSRIFRFTGVPSSVLIDRNGVITHRWIGPFDPMSTDDLALLGEALAVQQVATAARNPDPKVDPHHK